MAGRFLSQKYPALRRSAVRSPKGAASPAGSNAVSHELAYADAFARGTAPKNQGEVSEASSRTPASCTSAAPKGGGGAVAAVARVNLLLLLLLLLLIVLLLLLHVFDHVLLRGREAPP